MLKQISQAARGNQAEQTWRGLQAYARVHWPETPPKTPLDWAHKLKHKEVETILAELEASLFRDKVEPDWNGERVRRVLLPLLDQNRSENTKSRGHAVPDMYPPS